MVVCVMVSRYLDDGAVTYVLESASAHCIESCASLPRASRTCPERSVPSGSVRETISLNRGNLTCPPFV
jgi:hypothetical protein